jgi:hypothetical protein
MAGWTPPTQAPEGPGRREREAEEVACRPDATGTDSADQQDLSANQARITEAPTEILCRNLTSGEIDIAIIVSSPDLRKLIQEPL